MPVFFYRVLSCVGRGLAIGRSIAQGVLPINYMQDSLPEFIQNRNRLQGSGSLGYNLTLRNFFSPPVLTGE
jgi:hypothetical protein